MEIAHRNFLFGNYSGAVEAYSKLLETLPEDAELLLCRAIAYIQTAQYDSAITDLEQSEKLKAKNFQTHLRLGIAQFYKGKLSDARSTFKDTRPLAESDSEKALISSWMQKCACEEGIQSATRLNQSALMPMSTGGKQEDIKTQYDWYQSATHVDVTLRVRNCKKETVNVVFGPQELEVTIKLQEEDTQEYSYNLSMEIIPEESSYSVDDKKIEIKLKKKDDGIQWATLEKVEKKAEFKPAYPSSAKKKVDWNKLDKEVEREDVYEKPEGDDALNNLFKAIYAKADENTRKAMIKSFQTSGGTVLSTNWKEVQEKDYESKDRPEPPKGQEWRKPEL